MSLCLSWRLMLLAWLSLACAVCCQSPLSSYGGRNIGDQFGWFVAPGGDMTGDGVTEYVVGAPHDNTAGVNSGSVHVFDGATHLPIHILEGPAPYDHFGWRVSELGDVTGDGNADILVGNTLSDLYATSAGSVHVYDGVTGVELYAIHATVAWDQAGRGLCPLGDIDNDGAADFAFGTPFHDVLLSGGGRVDIVSGATGTIITTIAPTNGGGHKGFALTCPGDVTGDGINDLLVGAPRANVIGVDSGIVHLHEMPSGNIISTYLPAGPGEELGTSLAAIPDLDGDGKNDFISGAPTATPFGPDSGKAYVFSTGTGAILHSYDGESLGELFGFAVGGMEDVTGDGIPDFMVGAPWAAGGGVDRGVVKLYSGANGTVARTYEGVSDNEYLGHGMSHLPDINGDGLQELLLGATQYQPMGASTGPGAVYIMPGSSAIDASLTDLGGGCPFSVSTTPVLSGDPPVLGASAAMQVDSTIPGGAVTFFIAAPTNPLWTAGESCLAFVGPSHLLEVGSAIADASGLASTSIMIPSDPTAVGIFGFIQAVTVAPVVQASNGMMWVLGY